ncbi:ferredoxin [Streptomyces sp. NPDC002817]|uniref:ferredoxin n=1 Tax=Streptomyces sp. NPDC088357 TaxID=3154655 RepID=UPI003441CE2B
MTATRTNGAEDEGTVWEISVDTETCVGSGVCTHLAARRFQLAEGRSRAVSAIVPADQSVLDAAESCPMESITVVERSSGHLLAPRP